MLIYGYTFYTLLYEVYNLPIGKIKCLSNARETIACLSGEPLGFHFGVGYMMRLVQQGSMFTDNPMQLQTGRWSSLKLVRTL